MLFNEWLFINELKTEIFDVHAKEFIIKNRLNNIINEALLSTGFLEEKLINEGVYKKSSFQIMLENRKIREADENQESPEDEGPAELEDPFAAGDEMAEPVKGSDKSGDVASLRISTKRKKLLKRLKDLMLQIRWSAMRDRQENIKKLADIDSEYKKNSMDENLDKERRSLLKKLGYIRDKNEDEKVIEKAVDLAVAETGNEDNFASVVNKPIRTLINEFGTVASELFHFADESKSSFHKAGFKTNMEPSDVLNSYFMNMVDHLTKRKVSPVSYTLGKKGQITIKGGKVGKWPPLVGGLGQNLSDLERDDWTSDPNVQPEDRGILNQVLSYNTTVIYTSPKLEKIRSRQKIKRKAGSTNVTNRTEIMRIINKDLSENKLDFYKKYLEDGVAISYPEDNLDRIGAVKMKKYRTKIIKSIMDLSEKSPRDYVISPITDENIKQALVTYLNYEVLGGRPGFNVMAASELSTDSDEGSSDREAAIWSGRADSWGGVGKEGDPAQMAAKSEIMNKIRSALEKLFKQYDKRIGLAYCLSLGLDCSGGVPSALEISPLYKSISTGVSTKIDMPKLQSAMKDAGIFAPGSVSEPVSTNLIAQWLKKARDFMQQQISIDTE